MIKAKINPIKIIHPVVGFCRKKPGLIFVFLLVIFIGWAAWIFEHYVYQAVYFNKEVSVQEIKINQALFEKVKTRFQEKEANFSAPNDKTYPGIFGSPPLQP